MHKPWVTHTSLAHGFSFPLHFSTRKRPWVNHMSLPTAFFYVGDAPCMDASLPHIARMEFYYMLSQKEKVTSTQPLWRNRDYLLLQGGQLVSFVGDQQQFIALPLLILALTGSALQAGIA